MPKLVCDMPAASEQVEYYTIAGLPGNPTAPKLASGTHGFEYDLSTIPPGTYSVQCSACNMWMCSLPAPLEFTRPSDVTLPASLRLVF